MDGRRGTLSFLDISLDSPPSHQTHYLVNEFGSSYIESRIIQEEYRDWILTIKKKKKKKHKHTHLTFLLLGLPLLYPDKQNPQTSSLGRSKRYGSLKVFSWF